MNLKRLTCSIAVLGMALLASTPVAAQGLYTPVAKVNQMVVTEFEVQQRQKFLQALNAPGATREGAIESLIDERLRNEAVTKSGIELSAETIDQSLSEFAGRANLSTDEFVKRLEQAGISRETFRDFVVNSIGWRELIRGLYGSRTQITDAEISRALGSTRGSGVRVLMSEIIIPAPPQDAARINALAEQISQSKTAAEFSNYATKYSATASRGNGGRLDWQNLSDLPPSLQPLVMGLAPGQVTDPLPIPEAEGVRARVDTCDDLYGVAKGKPVSVLDRETKKPGEIPQDIALELSKLDQGEVSTALTRANGQSLVFLMLCGRTASANESASRDDVINVLRQERLSGYADQLLEQLRANARIVRK